MLVVHAEVHEPQWLTLLVVSRQAAPQSVGMLAGQPDVHA